MPASPAKLGRPTETDPHEIVEVALRLFEKNGFDAVTMDEIAKASSVSRRTLFRHFSSKSDLVWAGIDDFLGILRALAVPLAGKRLRLSQIVDALFVPVLTMIDDDRELERMARRRLRLVATAPTLLHHETLQEIERLIAALVASSALPKDVPAPLVARTLVAAAFTSLLWWAQHGANLRATDATLGALDALARARA